MAMFYLDEEQQLENNISEEVACDSISGGNQMENGLYSGEAVTFGSNLCGGQQFDDEEDEEPSELVPLGQKNANMFGRRRQKNSFYDFYKLTGDVLGSGAYASVRTAVRIASGNECAVKIIDKHHEGRTRGRIMREIDTFLLCKHHPNIVQLHEWFEDKNNFYLVFEKMRGGPLLNHIQRKVYFTEQEASNVTRDIVCALKYLHDKGIAHRDIKPENILCTDPDRVSPVKLCDLDLASKVIRGSPTTSPTGGKPTHADVAAELTSPVGSAEFMAPEVVDAFVGDALKYDKRCDMWSLGVIIYIMLCGYPPFYGECWRSNCGWDQGEPCRDCQDNLFARIQLGEFDFPEEEWGRVSMEAKDLILRLLVKDVRLRYTTDDVLKHPWIRGEAPRTPLQTPDNLFRNDSARDLHQMNQHFTALNRMAGMVRSGRENSSQVANQQLDDIVVGPDEDTPIIADKNIMGNNNNAGTLKKSKTATDRLSGTGCVSKKSANASTYGHLHHRGGGAQAQHHHHHLQLPYDNNQRKPSAPSALMLPLETCQNAMARQDSSTELHAVMQQQQREAQVQV